MENWTNKNCNNNEFYDPNLLADNDRLFKSSILAQLEAISKRIGVIEDKLNIINSDKVCPSTDKWETRKKNIEECIEFIDWEKIHKVMVFLNWQWIGEGPDGELATPSINSLKEHARKDLVRCYEGMDKYNNENDGEPDSYIISSGGIKVRTYPDNHCSVYFILTDYDTGY